MKSILPEKITILSHNMHVAIMRFLEKYNELKQLADIKCLLAEMNQPYLVRSTWIDWENAFKKTLIELNRLQESDFKHIRKDLDPILPEMTQVSSQDVYYIIINFLENYNCDLQSPDIKDLISLMKQPDIFPAIWYQWETTLKTVLEEST